MRLAQPDLQTPEQIVSFLESSSRRNSRSLFVSPRYSLSASTDANSTANLSVSTEPPGALLIAAKAYMKLNCLEEAAGCLTKHVAIASTAAEGLVLLARVYQQKGDLALAKVTCSKLVDLSDSNSQLTNAIELFVELLKETGDLEILDSIMSIIVRLCSIFKEGRMNTPPFTAIKDLLEYLVNLDPVKKSTLNCDALLKEIVFLSSLNGFASSPIIHIALLKYYTAQRDIQRMYALIEANNSLMRYCKDWLFAAKSSLALISHQIEKKPFQHSVSLRQIELQLDIVFHLIHILVKNIETTELPSDLFEEYAQLIEESDSMLTNLKSFSSQQEWAQMRMEHLARLYFLKGLSLLWRLPSSNNDALFYQDLRDTPADTNLHFDIMRMLLLSLSDAPSTLPKYRNVARIIQAVHLVAAFRVLETDDEPFSKTIISKISPNPLDIGDVCSSVLKNHTWLSSSFNEMTTEGILENPWDLELFITVASWNLYNNNLRKFLRLLFPRMLEESVFSSPEKATRQNSRTIATIADMEVFMIIMCLERRIHEQLSKRNNTASNPISKIKTGSMFICRPLGIATQFWMRMLVLFGKPSAEANYFSTIALTELQSNVILTELHGRLQAHTEHMGILFGSIGVILAELGHSCLVNTFERARRFLKLSKSKEIVYEPHGFEHSLINSCFRGECIKASVLKDILGISDQLVIDTEASLETRSGTTLYTDSSDIKLASSTTPSKNLFSKKPAHTADYSLTSEPSPDKQPQPQKTIQENPSSCQPSIVSKRIARQLALLKHTQS
ncbi:hypothetical protein O5D80_000929 [Batrachochytrium dendrobatidis]|nr:hypothetical protein O5D80_000929 [Batrachochytrium dendrobatidis]